MPCELDRQAIAVFDALQHFAFMNGEMPTFDEIADQLGLDVLVAIRLLRQLRQDGLVDWEPERPRSFRVLRRVD
jgi:DNA-binding IclR family transcriptional regulator